MDAQSLQIFQEVLLGINAVEAAKPYLDKIAALDAAGASGDAILEVVVQMRKDSGAKLDADLAA